MKKFLLHWLTGETEKVEGDDIANAMTLAGYSSGALRALDYFEEIKNQSQTKNLDNLSTQLMRGDEGGID